MSTARYPDLSGKTVLVSGGATGIGRAIVEGFLGQVCRVAILDVDEGAGVALERAHPDCAIRFHRCDVTDAGDIAVATNAVREAFGPISVLVNNAASDMRHRLEDVGSDEWDRLVGINLKHQFFLTQAVRGDLVETSGSIVNLSSISWRRGVAGLPVYLACKAGVEGLTRALARELGGDGVRVNAILPGMVLTPRQLELWLTPEVMAEGLHNQCLKRHVQPSDVADAAVFLASSSARSITSQSIVVDGGWI